MTLALEVMDEELCQDLETGQLIPDKDVKVRARQLSKYRWNDTEKLDIWAFGSRKTPSNVLINKMTDIQSLKGAKPLMIDIFRKVVDMGYFVVDDPM